MLDPVLFEIFGFEIRWYSVLILLAVIIAYFLILNESKRFQISKEFIFNLMFWVLIFGILGARLYYVVFNFNYYKSNPIEILKIWNGGLAIHGGMLFGLITIIIYCKKYHIRIKKMLDIMAPALIIGQAIGRWGNFFNQEAYGKVVAYKTLVNMKIIPQFVIDNMSINGVYHLPMFYFESLGCLLGFIILLIIRRRKYTKISQVFASYLVIYGLIRFFIEFFRTDALMLGSIRIAQVVSVIMFLGGIILFITANRGLKLDNLYNKPEEDFKF